MSTEVKLPQYAMGCQDGTVAHWYKSVGDYVEADEDLIDVEEAKTSEVVKAPETGYVLKILVPEGEVVPVRTVLCLIGSQEELQSEQSNAVATINLSISSEAGVEQVTPVLLETEIRLSGMRGVVAKHMTDSLANTAQFTLTMQADVTGLLHQREVLKKNNADFTHVSLTDVIIKATAMTLKDHPRLNGWVEGEKVRLPAKIHIGLAVAIEEGLIVPVLCNADQKNLREIAMESKQLAKKAIEKTLSTEEFSGSTFTITNLGMYGVDFFTPIINLPEVAILGIGAIHDYPVVESNELVWRKGLPLSLTIDHRAVDGAPAALFLRDLKNCLEQIDLTKL